MVLFPKKKKRKHKIFRFLDVYFVQIYKHTPQYYYYTTVDASNGNYKKIIMRRIVTQFVKLRTREYLMYEKVQIFSNVNDFKFNLTNIVFQICTRVKHYLNRIEH